MLVCHTNDLVKAHEALKLKGVFKTDSSGSSAQNCFAFPSNAGSWVVRRHGRNVQEAGTWTTDSSGWTKCNFNTEPTFLEACRTCEGIECSDGSFAFITLKDGLVALGMLHNMTFEFSEAVLLRRCQLSQKKESRVVLSIPLHELDENSEFKMFTKTKKGDKWEMVIYIKKRPSNINTPDHIIRHAISKDVEAGWWIKVRDSWVSQTKSNVVNVLLSEMPQLKRADLEIYLGRSILDPWEIVNLPFEDEYPGNRKWNRCSAQLACKPEEGAHPTWNTILQHIGKGLDEAVENDIWCKENGLVDGSEYLLMWIASMFQYPERPLPFLFLVGGQNTGKSTLHESLALLFKDGRGYARADQALTNASGFNGELEGAILGVIEETNLSRHKAATERIKDLVTGVTIMIRALYKNGFNITNTLHFIQCSNESSACPVFPGDTRVVVITVDQLENDIPKGRLFEQLQEEKAAFLHTIMGVVLSDPPGRLGVPCLSTEYKRVMENVNKGELECFLDDRTEMFHGEIISFEEFMENFSIWLASHHAGSERQWNKNRVARELPRKRPHCRGRMGQFNKIYLGNIKWANKKLNHVPKETYICESGRLKTIDINKMNREMQCQN